jgi:mycobactin peptide synthetase MbtF
VLDTLPVTVHGKVDRAALPAPDFAALAGGRAPATEREEQLCALFAEILGLDKVGADDSFFTLGGDSIMSMQLAARARRAGLEITPQDVFECETPTQLAARAAAGGMVSGPDTGTAELPLTPAMQSVLDRATTAGALHRFAQWTVLSVPAGLDETALAGALGALAGVHPMLRAQLRPGGTLMVGGPQPATPAGWLHRAAAAGRSGPDLDQVVAAETTAACLRLDPAAGVMAQAVWVDAGPDQPGRLVLAAHHLAVDTMSWRNLLPDLEAAYTDLAAGRDPDLLPEGTSFRRWMQTLAGQAADPARVAELDQWSAVLAPGEPMLGSRPLDPAIDTAASMRQAGFSVPAEHAATLVTSIPAAFHCGVHEVLLAGLAAAVGQWRAQRGLAGGPVLLDVEGHGREPLTAGMDLSRAVGCFTGSHPIRLDPGPADYAAIRAGQDAAGDLLKAVKEQARTVPGDGLGYGLLRYLNPDTGPVLAALTAPQIGFNYLGRAGAGPDRAQAGGPATAGYWQPAGAAAMGGDSDPRLPAMHAVEASAVLRDRPAGPDLRLWLAWPAGLLDEAAIHELGQEWAAMLAGLADHAARPGAGGHTPSDFALVSLAQEQIEKLEAGLAADFADGPPERKAR